MVGESTLGGAPFIGVVPVVAVATEIKTDNLCNHPIKIQYRTSHGGRRKKQLRNHGYGETQYKCIYIYINKKSQNMDGFLVEKVTKGGGSSSCITR